METTQVLRFIIASLQYCILDSVVEKAPLAVMDMDSFNLEVLIISLILEEH